jgi:phenylacetate-CoA ligase
VETKDGLHIWEDHFWPEIIDPETGRALPDGEKGELVFTTLTKEALPLIRYRTGDLGAVTEEPCRCGRTTARLIQLGGRRDDMMIIRGVNLYPSHIEQILMSAEGVAPHWQLILERPGPMDELTLECEPATVGEDREDLRVRLETLLKEGTGVRVAVSVLEPGAVPRSEGKAVRLVDRR